MEPFDILLGRMQLMIVSGSICFGSGMDENAVYALIVVQLIDECEQFVLRRRALWKANGLTGHPRPR